MSNPSPAAVPIRPASTLVLVRGEREPEILLLLRHAQHGFMPNIWVFPGGRVDEADGVDDAGARRAAVRETWEEAGILLRDPVRTAGPEEVREVAAIDRAGSEPWPLACFARWLTPVGEKRRFDTRFYVARVPPTVHAVPDRGEVIDAVWLTPEAAFARHRAGTLALAPPTWWSLEAMRRLGSADAISAWASEVERDVRCVEPTLALIAGTIVVSTVSEHLRLPPGESVSGRLQLVRGVWQPAE